ncbi:DUF1501 domain-containing protein [Planctomycetales bacterium 10988]|nr:DUF1501 domain-containing protein [Planctomycetales bacterium 10988]
MGLFNYCDGMKRRDFLTAGAVSGLSLSLADYMRMAQAGQIRSAKAQQVLFVHLTGGPSHMDTFDLKPNAPEEVRGEFRPISTSAPGVQISEHLPNLAKAAKHFAILRGVSHTLAAHALGTQYLNTGNRPLPSLQFPGFGSVVSKELGSPEDVPPFVAIPDTPQEAGYLGVRYAPLETKSTPRMGAPFRVRGISLDQKITLQAAQSRDLLLRKLDTKFNALSASSEIVGGLDEFSDRANRVIQSPRTREAFDISRESTSVAESFGATGFGQSCLLAIRLLEAGVRFTSVSYGGWDTHQDNFARLKDTRLPEFDQGLAALFTTLHERGMLESTLVCVTGEFGRTPKINPRGGRDHWPRAMFVLLAGGGIQGGQVLGASNDKGEEPKEEAITPDQVAATIYHSLGINYTKEYNTTTGRPVMLVRDGQVLHSLFS